jgi:MscS family membrane protein
MYSFLSTESWLLQLSVILMLTVIADLMQSRILRKINVQLAKTENYWDDALAEAMRSPVRAVIWLLGVSYGLTVFRSEESAAVFGVIDSVRDVGVIIAFAWFMVRFIQRAEESYITARQTDGKEVDRTTADAVAKLLRLSVFIISTLVVLQTLGFSISGVLAFGGVGGIAVGFAAKDLLANFFGGLMVYLDRPFNVGDWIRSPDREIEGTVEVIGWRLTLIRTFDKRPLYIPNSLFNQIAVENPSRMTNRRIFETIGIRYEDASLMEAIAFGVKKMLLEHPDIDSSKTLIVNFNSFGSSSLDFFVYTFTKTTDWILFHEIKQDVMVQILKIIEAQGAECAYPTSTVHLAKDFPAPI